MLSHLLTQFVRTLGIFIRTIRAYFVRRVVSVTTRFRQMLNFSRHATKVASSSMREVVSAAQKPSRREDYIETGQLFISKFLILKIILVLVAVGLLCYFIIWPFLLSRFFTAKFYVEDSRVEDWSGKVIVYSDKKKKVPLYSGRLEKGVLQGEGREYDTNGLLTYKGQFVNGIHNGTGTAYENGIVIYEGQFAEGVYNGKGVASHDGFVIYEGQYEMGLRSGSGTAYEMGQVLYKGQFAQDLYEGTGKLYEDGELLYDGQFSAGSYEGTGKLYKDGDLVYDGQFAAGVFEGRGKQYEGGHLIFDGNFAAGVPEGDGTAYYSDGTVAYKGQYAAGVPEGTGSAYDESGRLVYAGGFSGGAYDGSGILYFEDNQQLEAEFHDGEPEGVVRWKKGGRLYYEGEWADEMPSGFGTLYNRAGKVIYQGAFLYGTIDGSMLCGMSTDEFKEALGEGLLRSYDSEEGGFLLSAPELGLTAQCSFRTEETPSEIYALYLTEPEEDWVQIMPGKAHVQSLPWKPTDIVESGLIWYNAINGVRLNAGNYMMRRVTLTEGHTSVYCPTEGKTVLMVRWCDLGGSPEALDLEDMTSSDADEQMEDFLDVLDEMNGTAGTTAGEGPTYGWVSPAEALTACESADQAATVADAMLSYWAQADRQAALEENMKRIDDQLTEAREALAKGTGSEETVSALEKQKINLQSEIDVCKSEQTRAELQAQSCGISGLDDYALGDMLILFDPSDQDFNDLALVASAYAQSIRSSESPDAVESRVKNDLVNLSESYNQVQTCKDLYESMTKTTQQAAAAFATGSGTKQAWYDAMYAQTTARSALSVALSGFSRQANNLNQLTGGWVSRAYGWYDSTLSPLFQKAIDEAEQKEKEEKEKEEQEKKEKEEQEKKEKEEQEKRESEKKESERQESERQESERQESERKESERKESERQESEKQKQTESESETQKQTESESETQKQTESESETQKQTESESETQKQTESESETQMQTESESETQKQTEPESESQPDNSDAPIGRG